MAVDPDLYSDDPKSGDPILAALTASDLNRQECEPYRARQQGAAPENLPSADVNGQILPECDPQSCNETGKADVVNETNSRVQDAVENAEKFRDPLDQLVEEAKGDPGAPLKPEVLRQLANLKRDDLAGYGRLRDRLKQETRCGMSLLDEGVKKTISGVTSPQSAMEQQPRKSSGRMRIEIQAGMLPEVIDKAEQALLNAKTDLYQRGNMIVRPVLTEIDGAGGRIIHGHRLVPVTARNLAELMTSSAEWLRYDKDERGWVRTDAPLRFAQSYLERDGHWKLRVLTGIISSPILRRDGSILEKPGYDEKTRLLFLSHGAPFPGIPTNPSRDEALQALELLRALISQFSFVSDADLAVALSAMLTGIVRRSMSTAPLHGFGAPVAGSGKSMLVDITSIMSSGRPAGVIAQGKTEEEMEKRLGAALIAGDQQISIDNCERPLGGELLCQALTQLTLKIRVLGRSFNAELPADAFICATGNNLVLLGDMIRRALLCSLDPGVERPELRKFDRDPIAEVQANRHRYVVAALTVLRAFHCAGSPQQADPLGSFVEWSRTVRDALIWLGQADPCSTMDRVRAADPKLETLSSVLEFWSGLLGERRVSAKEVIDVVTGQEDSASISSTREFRDALLSVAGDGTSINARRLGKWLGDSQNRVAAGLKVVMARKINGIQQWQVIGSVQGSRVD